jgi:pheromone a factor receptor
LWEILPIQILLEFFNFSYAMLSSTTRFSPYSQTPSGILKYDNGLVSSVRAEEFTAPQLLSMAPTSMSDPTESNPRSPLAIAFPILAAMACILYIPPLLVHVRGRNFAASVLMISFIVLNIFNFINPLIWPTEFLQGWWDGTGLCDIEVKLQIAFSAANVGSVACIFRQLAIILDTDRTYLVPSPAQRLRQRIFDIGLCVGVPVYLMAVHYIVQSSRYYIYSVEGCRPSFDNSWVSFVLIFIWPLILCSVGTAYGGLAAYRLIKYRQQFAIILAASTSSMTKSRFIRLFALSTSLILIYLPLSIFTFRKSASFPRQAYSWKRVHSVGWSTIIILQPGQIDGAFDSWIQIGTAFLVFPFFGLGQDAKALYRSWMLRMKLDCFKGPRTYSSGQTPLVAQTDEAKSGAGRTHESDTPQLSNTDMSITLHEGEPIQKMSVAKLSPGTDRSLQFEEGYTPAADSNIRKPCEEIRAKTRLRQPPTFKIWSDAEADLTTGSKQSIEVKNEFELTRHVAHQQV